MAGFKIGDVVRLVSGGPSMTVVGTPRPKRTNPRDDDTFIRCTWFTSDEDRAQVGSFPPAALKRGPKVK
jgi:uncharacterized protein YodC (DUF2158 family)